MSTMTVKRFFAPFLLVGTVGLLVSCGQESDVHSSGYSLADDSELGKEIGTFRAEFKEECKTTDIPKDCGPILSISLKGTEDKKVTVKKVVVVYEGASEKEKVSIAVEGLDGEYGKNAHKTAKLTGKAFEDKQGKKPLYIEVYAKTAANFKGARGRMAVFVKEADEEKKK